MLRPHSWLWHCLWVGPNVLFLGLAGLMAWRRMHRQYPFFFAFAFLSSLLNLGVYIADLTPLVAPDTYWILTSAELVVEALLKIGVVAEIFSHFLGHYAAIARSGKRLIQGAGIVLIFAAALVAAFTPQDAVNALVRAAHLIAQTVFFVEFGLLISIFVASYYFQLRPARHAFGIALGLAIGAGIQLGAWLIGNSFGMPLPKRVMLDFVDMGAYQVSMILWYYYLLVPEEAQSPTIVLVPEDNLVAWNQELERFLQQ